ncbi:MAG: general secretion pathway protein GspL [Burkholderiaceae bacterium]|nr:general secretion pathway protein GspL [Burkholderiaceae bacterium]
MSTLIIVLPLKAADALTTYSYVRVGTAADNSGPASAVAGELPKLQRAVDETLVVVPVEALAWQRVELPKGVGTGSPRLRTVLNGLLEEKLLDEVPDLHLAIEPQPAAGSPVWVAACNRQWLIQHLRNLEAGGQVIGRIVPEFSPQSERLKLQVLGDPRPSQFVLTGPGVAGGVIRLPLASTSLAMALGDEQIPANLECLAEPAVAADAEKMVGNGVTLQQPAERWALAASSPWDLAQFELASSGRIRAARKLGTVARSFLQAPAWRPARWGVVLLLLANLAGLNAWAWKEQQSAQHLRTTINKTLTQAFPQVRLVVDAPVQMARELSALQQAAGAPSTRDLEVMLGALANAAATGQSPTAIEYSAGQARLKGMNITQADLPAIAETLRPQGYSLRLEGDVAVLKAETAP